jgi:transposase
VIKREKRACPQCEEAGVQIAPLAPKIIEKGKASDRVVIDVLVKKYGDHLPLYRQAAILERDWGVELSCATMGGWVGQAGEWLAALTGAMRMELLAGPYLQADETTVGVQSAQTKGRNHQGFLWQYSRPGGPVVFDFQMGRGRDGPKKFLGQFAGFLQCDGFSAYDKLGGPGLVYAGCWAHARRGFVDALKLNPKDLAVAEVIAEIGKLYAVEKQAREAGDTPAERATRRQEQSVPQLLIVKTKIIALRQKVLPQSAAGKACDYALSQWSRLEVYARPEGGEVEIDNNWCENAMRPVALGRKNWLHIGSEAAGPGVAAIASIIETCRRLEINPRAYLLDVLPLVPGWPQSRIAELTPARWKERQAAR